MLRHARKLPDKTTQFYKELNRLKRAAVCLGGCSSLHDDEKLFPIILYFLLQLCHVNKLKLIVKKFAIKINLHSLQLHVSIVYLYIYSELLNSASVILFVIFFIRL